MVVFLVYRFVSVIHFLSFSIDDSHFLPPKTWAVLYEAWAVVYKMKRKTSHESNFNPFHATDLF